MKFKTILTSFSFIILLIILLPLIKILFSSSPEILIKTAKEKEVINSILLTFRASLWSSLFAIIFGIPVAYLIAREDFKFKKIVEGIIDIPVIIPHTAAGIALLSVIGRNSIVSKIFGGSLIGTEIAISIGMFFVSVPFLINSVKDGFKMVDVRYENTAITLGASRFQAFYTISLPMVKKSIITGFIMMWGRGISEFGAVIILAYHPITAPVLIFERFQNFGLKYAVPITVILIILTLIIFIFARWISDKDR